MTDQLHQDAMAGVKPCFPLGDLSHVESRRCAACIHFARLAEPQAELHGICAEHLTARSYAPVVAESDGRYCASFKDASEARVAAAVKNLEREDAS